MTKYIRFFMLFVSILVLGSPGANAQIPNPISGLSLAGRLRGARLLPTNSDKTIHLHSTLSLRLTNVSLSKALDEITSKTGVHFSYSKEVVPVEKEVNVNVQDATLAATLDETLAGTNLTWVPVASDQIVVTQSPQAQQGSGTIKGKVVDQSGNPLAFANILIVGTSLGASADVNGMYTIKNVPSGTHALRASAVGYGTVGANISVSEGGTTTQDFTLAQDVLGMREVVVTGTTIPVQKLNSTNSISTVSPKDLTLAQPQSTTEFLRYVPGFTRIESSGGYVNENYTMRGIYGVTTIMFMQDGLPVFPTQNIFFMNTDNLFRIDDNVQRVEVVRGGNAGLFGSNTPAAVINLISKTGGPTLQGETQAQVGTQGLAKVDFNVNGPLGPEWRFNFGGFYLYDHGVRDPGFPGNQGGQLEGNITRLLDNGYVRVYGKYINDQSQFILDLPHGDPANPTAYVSGFGDYGSFSTPEGLGISVPTPTGALSLPLGNGLSTNAGWLTADISLNFPDGWNVRNEAQVMSNQQQWNAVVPFSASPIASWESSELGTLEGMGIIPANPSTVNWHLTYTNEVDAAGNHISFPNSNYSPNNGLIAPGGEWHVAKPMSAFQEQLQLNKSLDLGGDYLYHHDISLGIYFANYSMTNNWYFSNILTDVQDITHFIDASVTYTDPNSGASKTVNVTNNGFMQYVSNYVNGSGLATVLDGVLSDQMMVTDRLRFNIAGRLETDGFVQSTENTSNVQPNGSPVDSTTPPYAIETWGNNSYRHMNSTINDWALSGGLNYDVVPDELALYANASRAYVMPSLDNLLNDVPAQVAIFKDETSYQAEGGVKYYSDQFSVNADVFWGDLKNITSQGAVVGANGQVVWITQYSPETQSYGIEADVTYSPISGLSLRGNWTLLQAKYSSGAGPDVGSLINGIPNSIGNLVGTYTMDNWTLDADWHYVGNRIGGLAENGFTSNGQAVLVAGTALPSYNYMNLGLSYFIPSQAITLSLAVTNVYQSLGLEEGNPREGSNGNYFLARPILPRRLTFSVGYQF
jgi:outer membrane receptor protein involved in Fe transport